MFKIYGGATEFNQWEQGKLLTEEHMAAGDRVVFRSGCGEAVPVQAKTQGGTVVVDVPNELLMSNANIVVDLVGRPSCATLFKVNACDRPADYEFVQNIIPPTDEPTGGTGSGGVSSWNDLTDKPFGEAVTELYSVENGAFPLYMGQMPMHFVPNSMFLINGQTYTVVWDGVPYDCVYIYMDGMGMMGNFGAMEGADTGEPFVYMYAPAEGMQGFMDIAALMSGNLTETNHSFSVTGLGVKKIDTQFIPTVAWNAESDEVPIRNQPCSIREKYEYTWDGDITGREKVEAYRNNNFVFYYVKIDEIKFPTDLFNVKCFTMSNDNTLDAGSNIVRQTYYSHGVTWGSKDRPANLFYYNGGAGLPDFIYTTNNNGAKCSLGNGFSISKGVWFLYLEDMSGNTHQFTSVVEAYVFDNHLTSAYFNENTLDISSIWTHDIILRSTDGKSFFSIEVDGNGNLTATKV